MDSLNTDWRKLHFNHFRGKRILITGGAGFIGSHLVEVLVSLGAHVVVIDDLNGGSVENIKNFPRSQDTGTLDFVKTLS